MHVDADCFALTVIGNLWDILVSTVQLLHDLIQHLAIIYSWCGADSSLWSFSLYLSSCWIDWNGNGSTWVEEILLSCLCHHETHPSDPRVSLFVFVLDSAAECFWCNILNNVRIPVWWLPSVHFPLIHPIGYESYLLVHVCCGGIGLDTLVSLLFGWTNAIVACNNAIWVECLSLVLHVDVGDTQLTILAEVTLRKAEHSLFECHWLTVLQDVRLFLHALYLHWRALWLKSCLWIHLLLGRRIINH